jgi:hypothetical protein
LGAVPKDISDSDNSAVLAGQPTICNKGDNDDNDVVMVAADSLLYLNPIQE